MKRLMIVVIAFLVVLGAGMFMMMKEGSNNQPDSEASTEQSQLANPASVNCGKVGGTLEIKTNGSGAEYGLCMFEDNMACEEWALFRGECPVGGVKTTGYDNIQQMYCAWSGGQTLAVQNAKCTLPNSQVCPVDEYYNGTCPDDTITNPNQGS